MSMRKRVLCETKYATNGHDAVIKCTLLFHPSIYSAKAAKTEAATTAARDPTAPAETPRAAAPVVLDWELEGAARVELPVLALLAEDFAAELEADEAPERVAAGALA